MEGCPPIPFTGKEGLKQGKGLGKERSIERGLSTTYALLVHKEKMGGLCALWHHIDLGAPDHMLSLRRYGELPGGIGCQDGTAPAPDR